MTYVETRPTLAEFVEAIRARLAKGAIEYGDRSFERPASDLLGEISEELADVCGWAFVLWALVHRLREQVEQVEAAQEHVEVEARVSWDDVRSVAISMLAATAPGLQVRGWPPTCDERTGSASPQKGD